jgi:hypothetical protein
MFSVGFARTATGCPAEDTNPRVAFRRMLYMTTQDRAARRAHQFIERILQPGETLQVAVSDLFVKAVVGNIPVDCRRRRAAADRLTLRSLSRPKACTLHLGTGRRTPSWRP